MSFSRKTLVSCFLILAIAISLSPTISRAQGATKGTCTITNADGSKSTLGGIQVIKDDCTKYGGQWVPGQETQTNSPGNTTGTNSDKGNRESCFDFGGVNLKQCVASLVNIALGFFSFLLGISAFLLNLAIKMTIVDLRANLEGITAIKTTWATIRDLINLSFIFILLFAAIRTVLGLESPGKVIKNIVLAAIFINFSMFFARVMIDASNSVTLFFYDRLTDNSSKSGLTIDLGDARADSLVNAYVGPLKLQTIYGQAEASRTSSDPAKSAVNYSTVFTVGIFGSIMLALVAFVFLTISIMFIVRYAALVLLLIFSPLGFVSKDLPMVGEYGKQWWEVLKSQLLFPPIFMILTWITLNVIATIGTSTNGNLRAAFSGGDGAIPSASNVGLILNFLIIMTLIVMSLLISIETASKGSSAISGLYKKASKWAGSAMFGTAGGVGRWAIGGTANLISSNKNLQVAASSNNKNWASRLASRTTLGLTDWTKTKSFDARGGASGDLMSQFGIDAGKATGDGGFEKTWKDTKESFSTTGTDAAKAREERARKARGALDINAGIDAAEKDEKTRTAEEKELVDKMEKAMSSMTDKEIEALVSENRKLLDKQSFANKLSVQQLEAINKSDKFSETEKQTLKDARFGDINADLASGGPLRKEVIDKIKGLTDKEIEMINPSHLGKEHFVANLKASQVEAIKKSNKFTSSQKATLKEQRKIVFARGIRDNPATVGKADAKELANSDGLLTDPAILEHLSAKKLKKVAGEIDDDAKIQAIDAAIKGATAPPGSGLEALQKWRAKDDYKNNFFR